MFSLSAVHNFPKFLVYEKLGLQPGDRILSFDGKNVESPKDSMELYNDLKKGSVKTVVIKRNGKKQTLNYEVK